MRGEARVIDTAVRARGSASRTETVKEEQGGRHMNLGGGSTTRGALREVVRLDRRHGKSRVARSGDGVRCSCMAGGHWR
jgi:hypothetical protein